MACSIVFDEVPWLMRPQLNGLTQRGTR
jgi:hypothetical protein